MYKYLPVTSFCAPFCPAPGCGRPPLSPRYATAVYTCLQTYTMMHVHAWDNVCDNNYYINA